MSKKTKTKTETIDKAAAWKIGVVLVKVQLAQGSTDGVARCLVTNEEGTIFHETTEASILKAMAGRPRVYFWAQLEGTFLSLQAEAVDQDQDW
jgi:hypothetical protein